jgi:hypothetical protein
MRSIKFILVFLLVAGWPQISGFPPEIQKAQAA